MPRQLPEPPDGVIDRTDDTEPLAQAFRELTTPGGAAMIVLSGASGLGTTTLARVWARRARYLFPGGQLYIDGAAYSSRGLMSLCHAVGDCLRTFGVPNDAIPIRFGDRTRLFWKLLAERPRTLVLFDDATEPAQVRTFAPRDSHSKILVASRRSMMELRLDGAHLATLPPMSQSTSIALLRNLCGWRRIDYDPAAAQRLAALCGGRPLDLRVAAAQLAARPRLAISDYLNEVSVDLDTEPRVVDHAYRHLTTKAAEFYRRLGAIPGLRSFTADTAGVAGRIDPLGARQLLSELTTAGLLHQSASGYWAFPRLVAWHALKQTEYRLPETAVEVATALADYYLAMTSIACLALTGRTVLEDAMSWRLSNPFTGPKGTLRAIGWLASEWVNVLAVLYTASRAELRQAWQLAEALTDMLRHRRCFDDALEAIDCGIYAACGDRTPPGAAAHLRLRITRADVWLDLNRLDFAQNDLDVAVELTAVVNDPGLWLAVDELHTRFDRCVRATNKPPR